MKSNGLYALTAGDKRGVPLYSKIFIASVIMALIVALLPVASVLAAPNAVSETDDLAKEWSNKIRNLRYYAIFYEQVRLYPADFEDLSDLARAQELLNKYGFALRRAQTIVATRPGFDINGRVTDEKQALKSVEDLAENLRIMRGMWSKLEEGGYKIRRLR